jgi:hypothetical protein
MSVIDYLIELEYPDHGWEPENEYQVEMRRDLDRKIETYRGWLEKLDPEDLNAFAESKETHARDERRRKEVEWEESQRFFNLPNAKADFEVWSLMVTWDLDQTTALILNKEPSMVRWDEVQDHVQVSRFAKQYAQVRAFLAGANLQFPVRPTVFLAFAQARRVHVPEELFERLQANPESLTQGSTAEAPQETSQQTVQAAGGTKKRAAMEVMIELWGANKPLGVTGYGAAKVHSAFKERGIVISDETIKRAWNDLYGRNAASK